MAFVIDLPPEVERELREEAALTGQAPERLLQSVLRERFRERPERSRRIAALLDQWDAEDEAHTQSVAVADPPRMVVRVSGGE